MNLIDCKKYIKKIISSLIASYAIYLSFKRNRGVSKNLIIAFLFSHFYILYALAVPVKNNVSKEIIYIEKK